MTHRRPSAPLRTGRLLARLLPALLLLTAAACQPATLAPGEVPRNKARVPRISVEEFKERLDAGEKIVIVDSRPLRAYNVRHLPGALSIPLQEIDERAGELRKKDTIVFYCTWVDEDTSAGSALKLYKLGYTDMYALKGGLVAWEVAGYPVESP